MTGRTLGNGGQGTIHDLRIPAGHVLKKLHEDKIKQDGSDERRIKAMLARPPENWRDPDNQHLLLAWPTEIVYERGRFVGYLMPKIDSGRSVGLHNVENPTDREHPPKGAEWLRGFTWRYLVNTASNLALAVSIAHKSDVVIGDFNESNVLVGWDSRVTLVDCDSMQLPAVGPSGERYLCSVGKPEYVPPELQANWTTQLRSQSSDLFPLAIHIHQLLLRGMFPFDGVWSGPGDKPKRSLLAKQGVWVSGSDPRLNRRFGAIGPEILPEHFHSLFDAAFAAGAVNPRHRPTAQEWHTELGELSRMIATCRRTSAHEYYSKLKACPWCDLESRTASQTALPTAAVPPQRTVPPTSRRPPKAPQRRPGPPTGQTGGVGGSGFVAGGTSAPLVPFGGTGGGVSGPPPAAIGSRTTPGSAPPATSRTSHGVGSRVGRPAGPPRADLRARVPRGHGSRVLALALGLPVLASIASPSLLAKLPDPVQTCLYLLTYEPADASAIALAWARLLLVVAAIGAVGLWVGLGRLPRAIGLAVNLSLLLGLAILAWPSLELLATAGLASAPAYVWISQALTLSLAAVAAGLASQGHATLNRWRLSEIPGGLLGGAVAWWVGCLLIYGAINLGYSIADKDLVDDGGLLVVGVGYLVWYLALLGWGSTRLYRN